MQVPNDGDQGVLEGLDEVDRLLEGLEVSEGAADAGDGFEHLVKRARESEDPGVHREAESVRDGDQDAEPPEHERPLAGAPGCGEDGDRPTPTPIELQQVSGTPAGPTGVPEPDRRSGAAPVEMRIAGRGAGETVGEPEEEGALGSEGGPKAHTLSELARDDAGRKILSVAAETRALGELMTVFDAVQLWRSAYCTARGMGTELHWATPFVDILSYKGAQQAREIMQTEEVRRQADTYLPMMLGQNMASRILDLMPVLPAPQALRDYLEEMANLLGVAQEPGKEEQRIRGELDKIRTDPRLGVGQAFFGVTCPWLHYAVERMRAVPGVDVQWPGLEAHETAAFSWTKWVEGEGLAGAFPMVVTASRDARAHAWKEWGSGQGQVLAEADADKSFESRGVAVMVPVAVAFQSGPPEHEQHPVGDAHEADAQRSTGIGLAPNLYSSWYDVRWEALQEVLGRMKETFAVDVMSMIIGVPDMHVLGGAGPGVDAAGKHYRVKSDPEIWFFCAQGARDGGFLSLLHHQLGLDGNRTEPHRGD